MRKIDRMTNTIRVTVILVLCCLVITACAPTVKLETPQEPITINLNIKLDADIRVKLEEEAKKDIAANPGIF
ncbi:MAG: YnbE family lipoprotein [Nitrosomonas sp.]|jgi:predicted component of type VI protein secretion system|uniref:YnbE family lipoprotein n=1 Tax=Nitrosomonas sp. TaxID=42353 RepID=UPI00271BC282|nr:YnbE family lipoprotein [Nitrosomonas sp.]MDO8895187.1 YnbE family lipoprotein [Nitrosomonas sp.]MDO9470331.1 YnbE family lipoprotein [Nitrosomonas sp.]MDP1548569.1 YnbE family lipoprotein [Nitrosomonas sp.]MDP1787163.1 YnbE family lipoprotein [Nitrosomonas sp.]MDP1934988.1 YnbE family lipoprotein [Nitrosomonas sp.]